ncbi:MAG: hypothetical protein KDC79_03980 [Cyclobacteriaceae bacterium]|nr:hypothetical protein [Cyclobacteriaceae bacterium]
MNNNFIAPTIFTFNLLLSLLVLSSCSGQTSKESQTLHNEDFGWTITIPEDFVNVSPEEWKKMQNKGLDAIENTYGEEVVNQSKIVFVFKNADFNYMESNYQPFDTQIDGDYLESWSGVNEIVFETFRSQMPNARIDSISSVEKVSGLDFHTFKIKIDFPNGMIMHSLMYSRLFDKKEFSLNIIYVDEKQGEKMIDAWFNSRFE